MFWNLVSENYEKLSLHHVVLFCSLILYSYLGALMFVHLEGSNEAFHLRTRNTHQVRNSVAAKKNLVDAIQKLYFNDKNNSLFYETQIRRAIDQYDILMGQKPSLLRKRWDIWTGLYYVGTIYTTIGYGDVHAVTYHGRIFTMLYAVFGIPLLITVLNDWGTLFFRIVDFIWRKGVVPFCSTFWTKMMVRQTKRRGSSEEEIVSVEEAPLASDNNPDDPANIVHVPLVVVVLVLILWFFLSTLIFSHLQNWTFFESFYFFFISMTTIGFGDIAPSHRIAVLNFVPILIGLSVVSMSINVIQSQLEVLFSKIVKRIDKDFKDKIATMDERRQSSIGVTEDLKIERRKKSQEELDKEEQEKREKQKQREKEDVTRKYQKDMPVSDKMLLQFMSNHQKKLLNEKFESRDKMRNRYTQTQTIIKLFSRECLVQLELRLPLQTCGRCNGGIGGMTTTRRGGLGGVTTTRFGGGGLRTTPIFGGGVGSCVDQVNPRTGISDCSQRRSLCTDPRYQDLMRTQCPATCGLPCNGGIGSMTSTTRRQATRPIGTQATTTQFGCFDVIPPGKIVSDCQQFAYLCTKPQYLTLMKQVCCQTCSGGGTFTTQFGQTTTTQFGQTTMNPFGQTTTNPFGQTTTPFFGKKR
ncbi:hypothetical protein WR25_04723 [Diploscapter pachys]|uniref:ShKT domain-containing protein n=1 Tax=Diploscapter pachys TaxID=2018661 RepID=A0A2A2L697_9BILA|nr:hypothetical protein WR25_04723 [Diploscapter pachys]